MGGRNAIFIASPTKTQFVPAWAQTLAVCGFECCHFSSTGYLGPNMGDLPSPTLTPAKGEKLGGRACLFVCLYGTGASCMYGCTAPVPHFHSYRGKEGGWREEERKTTAPELLPLLPSHVVSGLEPRQNAWQSPTW